MPRHSLAHSDPNARRTVTAKQVRSARRDTGNSAAARAQLRQVRKADRKHDR